MTLYRGWPRVRLQLFAEKDGPGGEKTETATAKKRKDARQKGQVMKSAEIVTALVLLAAFFMLKICGGLIYGGITRFSRHILVEYAPSFGDLTARAMLGLYLDAGIAFLLSAGPVMAVAGAVAFAANAAQVGFQFTAEPLRFKPDRLNPVAGFKRMFSSRSLFNLLKSSVKVLIVGYVAYSFINGKLPELTVLLGANIRVIERNGFELIFSLAFRICAAILALAVVDYAWQWRQYERDLKMTKQEVKEEYKQMEGDPKIKAKIKEKQRRISMQRMMSDVPKADVVITNPTHYAVAVKYDLAIADAPVVLAKGQGYVALRIRGLAEDNAVPIVENKPLARTLFETVDVGAKIPAELYHAVAEVLAFVYNVKNKKIV